MDAIAIPLHMAAQKHGFGIIPVMLESLSFAHAVNVEHTKHGFFLKAFFPRHSEREMHHAKQGQGITQQEAAKRTLEVVKPMEEMDKIVEKDVTKNAEEEDKEGGKVEDSNDEKEDVRSHGKKHKAGKKNDKKGEAEEGKMDDEKADKEIGQNGWPTGLQRQRRRQGN